MSFVKQITLLWFLLLVVPHMTFAQDIRYNYDAAGRLISEIDAQGRTITYDYDALGNLLRFGRQDTVGQVAIALVTPDKGFIGTQVQIVGVGFSAVANENAIAFNGVSATVLTASTTALTTEVPFGATTGFITVKTPQGSATSPQPFTVLGGITVTPSKVTLARGNSQQFTATVTGPSDQRVVWSVNGINGGNSAVGTITQDGLYTSPFISGLSLTVTIKATSLAFPEFPDFSATATVTIVATCSVNWTGAGGNNLWQNSANWSTKVLPGVNDDVCVGAGFNVALSSGTHSIRSLTSDSALSISAATLSIANISTINHNFTLSGTLSGTGSLTVSGVGSWISGTMSGTGSTTFSGNLTITGNDFHDLTGGRTLNTSGTTTIGSGLAEFLRTGGGAKINNSGLWQDQSAFNYGITNVFGGAQSTFNNTGVYRKSNGGGLTTFLIIFNNTSSGAGTGVVDLIAGSLNLAGGGTANSGSTFTSVKGTILGFGGGNHSLQVGSVVNGSSVVFNGGPHNVNGSYTATEATTVISGTTNFNPGAIVTSVGALSIGSATSGTANFNTGGPINPTTLTLPNVGTLAGTDTVTVSGQTTWSGGTMSGTGITTLNGNATISGNSFHDLFDGRTLNTNATITFIGSFFRTSNGAKINSSGTWLDQSSINNTIEHIGGAQAVFSNTGVYRRNGSATTTIGIVFNNTSSGAGTGVVELLAGSLNLIGGGTANGGSTITGVAGTVLGFSGGIYGLEIGSSVAATAVVFGGGTTNVNGSYSATVSTTVIAGTANFNPGATVTSVGALSIGSGSGGTANFNTGGPINPTTLTLPNVGTLAGTDTVTVSGQTTWSGGTMSGTGITTLNGNATISGNSFHDLFDGRTLNTNATITFIGSFFRTSNGAKINSSGTWLDQSTANNTIEHIGGAQAAFNNSGTYRRNGTATTTMAIPFSNTGSVDVQSGTARFTGGYTQTAGETKLNGGELSSSTTINIQGGKLVGMGTVTANVSNAGQVDPGLSPGILNISGNYIQTAAGALNIEIGGLTAGTEFDRLSITGSATLNGTLNVSLVNGFTPTPGNSFQIMTFGSRNGTFTTINGLDLGGGRSFQVNLTGTSLSLVTPP